MGARGTAQLQKGLGATADGLCTNGNALGATRKVTCDDENVTCGDENVTGVNGTVSCEM